MKLLLPATAIIICLFAKPVFSQNVGIGTTFPSAKLEVKNPGISAAKISSHDLADTSQLILSNRNGAIVPISFSLPAMKMAYILLLLPILDLTFMILYLPF